MRVISLPLSHYTIAYTVLVFIPKKEVNGEFVLLVRIHVPDIGVVHARITTDLDHLPNGFCSSSNILY